MNHYELLDVETHADLGTITRAWKRQLLLWHPDRNHSPGALERSKRLNAAYEVLKDAKKRKTYDQAIFGARPARPRASTPARPQATAHNQGGQSTTRRARTTDQGFADLSSLAWDDDTFVVGHWYARSDGKTFRVMSISAASMSVRYATGETGLLGITKRWSDWQDFVVQHRPDSPIARARRSAAENARRAAQEQAKRNEAERAAREAADRARRESEEQARREAQERAAREDAERRMHELAELARHEAIEWEAQLIAFSAGPAAVAYFLQTAGWVTVQDNRPKGGLLHIFATEEAQDRVDTLMQELQETGIPFKTAPRKTLNGSVNAWWLPKSLAERPMVS